MRFGHTSHGIQKICLELASIIHANFHVAASVSPARGSMSLYLDFIEHYESVTNTKAIELAINLRALFDRCAALSNPMPLKQASQLTTAITFLEGQGENTLRECANKIIHAGFFEYEYGKYESTDETGHSFRNQVRESAVYIFGRRGKEPWRCKLDLLKFAEEAHLAATELRDFYDQ